MVNVRMKTSRSRGCACRPELHASTGDTRPAFGCGVRYGPRVSYHRVPARSGGDSAACAAHAVRATSPRSADHRYGPFAVLLAARRAGRASRQTVDAFLDLLLRDPGIDRHRSGRRRRAAGAGPRVAVFPVVGALISRNTLISTEEPWFQEYPDCRNCSGSSCTPGSTNTPDSSCSPGSIRSLDSSYTPFASAT